MTDTNRRYRLTLAIGFCLIALFQTGRSQVPNLEPNRKLNPPLPIVAFDFVWTSAKPAHYAIAVESIGNAAYRSDETFANGKPAGDPYIEKFVITEPTRSKIFELAKEANYFKGDFDFTKSRVANTGIKTLTYMEGNLVDNFDIPVKGQEHQVTYNWSQNPAIQQLTSIFQGISATFELGQKLEFERRFDKLGLDAELKSAEEMQKNGSLEQIQAIAPTLKKIADDVSVMHIARERAKRLLGAAGGQQSEQQTNPAAENR